MEYSFFGNRDANLVFLQMVDDHDLEVLDAEYRHLKDGIREDFCLIACRVDDWNRDLSPWEAPPVFGNEPFSGGAQKTLDFVLNTMIPDLFGDGKDSKVFYIGGYSLAALFALWAVYQTDRFAGAAAASPSIWFPGFLSYMKSHDLHAGKVYLSLGDKEEKTKNQVMASVGNCIRDAHAYLTTLPGVEAVLEWNPGNHFRDSDLRTAKAFAWLVN